MVTFLVGLFVVLHGLVHLLYFGQSWRYFELQPGMVWPDGSWAFSKILGAKATRVTAGLACLLAAAGFVAAGLAIFLGQAWWRPLVVASAAFSALLYLLFWDGQLRKIADKGGIALLIDLAILVAVLGLRWPAFEF
jgi:hypothetical protein